MVPNTINRMASAPAAARNVARLRLLMSLFRLEQADVVKASGYSKAFLSRLLNEEGFKASDRFWLAMNACLAGLIQSKAVQVFEVTPTSLPVEFPSATSSAEMSA